MSEPLKAEFRGITWWIRTTPGTDSQCLPGDLGGSCDPPDKKGRKWIYLRRGLAPKETLETAVHELLHAWIPQASEEAVEEGGRVIAGVLWRMGYRRKDAR